ncbi:MAG TPA: PepSY-associated TM helix domain-containing protein, partial [Janthinobacterium sp.]|nr:PepSY-associated TM helix domain-containing protein [Janthinobacterium sp.]
MTNIDTRHSLLALRKSLMWRIHFWAALIASPFALLATLTGIFYIFTPQIEDVLYARLDHVVASGPMRSLDDAVAAAQAAAPAGYQLRSALPAYGPDDTVKVYFTPPRPESVPGSAPAKPPMAMDMP